ncbi:MAG: hypothetical protein RLY93_07500 [Sumerlaeia bacterium]
MMTTWQRKTLAALFAFALASPAGTLLAQDEVTAEPAMETEAPAVEEAEPAPPAPTAEIPADAEDPGRIEATVEEIRAMINLPRSAQLGREADEDLGSPQNIFADESNRRQLLGEEPQFVYVPMGTDPMIIPWIRARIITQELLEEVANLETKGTLASLERALTLTDRILDDYYDETTAPMVEERQDEIRGKIEEILASPPEEAVDPETGQLIAAPRAQAPDFPEWVEINTLGVIVDAEDPTDSMVLIGNDIQQAGETVKLYPTVMIKEILPDEVIYSFEDFEYAIPIKGDVIADS